MCLSESPKDEAQKNFVPGQPSTGSGNMALRSLATQSSPRGQGRPPPPLSAPHAAVTATTLEDASTDPYGVHFAPVPIAGRNSGC
jgi:hypothetical protein